MYTVYGPPETYLCGNWDQRNWRNVPGPFYGAETDTCWTGRLEAPRHVLYDDEYGQEFVFRQPRTPTEVHHVLAAAWADPFRGYAYDGDQHWTSDAVRIWWRDRARLQEWIAHLTTAWSGSARSDEQEAATGLRALATYLDGGLETHLRGYCFWLEERRRPAPNEQLPAL
jgi:hypothetical protein